MRRLYSDGGPARAIVDLWPSVYHAVHVIVNRETICHRDLNGLPGWYDMLVSVGDYGEAALMSARTLGVSLPYDSGTVVMLCSRLITHGVPPVPPDRICLAWLMRDGILAHYKIHGVDWSFL